MFAPRCIQLSFGQFMCLSSVMRCSYYAFLSCGRSLRCALIRNVPFITCVSLLLGSKEDVPVIVACKKFEKRAEKPCESFQIDGGCENKPRVIPVLFTQKCVSNVFDLMNYAHGIQLCSGLLAEIRLRAFFRRFLLSKAPPHEVSVRGISQDYFGRHLKCFAQSFIDTST